jgi:23S rRNA pseudouridine1911/1915/1917 synthase
MRPGIVHRIDKDTSGLLVVAKNDIAHLALSEQLKTHNISRIYHAIIIGHLKDDAGIINAPIGRSLKDRKKMAVVDSAGVKSRNAVTHYKVIENFNGFSYIQCQLETGRTHQIRVHMAYLGHPIVGDPLYGGDKTKFQSENKTLFEGQCLHAKELTFIHPTTGENMHFECPLPENMELIIKKLR